MEIKKGFLRLLIQTLFIVTLLGTPFQVQAKIKMILPGSENLIITSVAGIDLDVTYINREPRYARNTSKQWPDKYELVTFTAHVINKGTSDSGSFSFQWLIDDKAVHTGVFNSLSSQSEVTHSLTWAWEEGRHKITFIADPLNIITETFENNNQVSDYTDALAVGFWVEQSVYDEFNAKANGVGTYSWEDWAQNILIQMNNMITQSIYPSAPQGGYTRVRLDKIVLVPDSTLFNLNARHAPYELVTDVQWGFSMEEYHDCSSQCNSMPWWVVHELMHYLYNRIDLYALDVQDTDVMVRDDFGILIAKTSLLPDIRWDVVHYVTPSWDLMHVVPDGQTLFSDYMLLSLNYDWPAGYRTPSSDWTHYFRELPADTKIRILDNNGQPIQNSGISVYQALPGDGTSGPYSQIFDNIADLTGFTDSQGYFSLGSHPFGDLDTYGTPVGIVLIKLQHPITSLSRYVWLELLDLNMAYWRGQTSLYTQEYRFPQDTVQLHLSSNNIQFVIGEGHSPIPQQINVEIYGDGIGQWNIGVSEASWLRTIPSESFSAKDYPPGRLTFIVDSKNLPIGTYTTQIMVYGTTGVSNSPLPIQVTLQVIPSQNVFLPLLLRDASQNNKVQVTADLDDGEILNINCSNWQECRSATSGSNHWAGLVVGTVGSTYNASGYTIQRLFLNFDTTGIPANAIINMAAVHLFTGEYQNGLQSIILVPSTAHIPLTSSDFGRIQFSSAGGIKLIAPNTFTSIYLNDVGKAWISKGGITELALIHEYDFNNITPTSTNDTLIKLTENTLYPPVLEIVYSIP